MLIKIGTRKSKLAMVQTEIVQKKIEALFPFVTIEIVPITTKGDEILDRSLASFGGKGVFTKELEDALLQKKIDMAVHSAKDMPMEFPEGLCVGAVLERANPKDVLVTLDGTPANKLPAGSVIGTSSLRRELQIKNINPLVQVKVLRGNVQTRLNKLNAGEYDGILLAAAGLERLHIPLENKNSIHMPYHFEYLDIEKFVPAAGQGILAVEIRQGELKEIMNAMHSCEAEMMLFAERHFLASIGGGCNAPCGAYSSILEGKFNMQVMYADESSHMSFCSQSISLEHEKQVDVQWSDGTDMPDVTRMADGEDMPEDTRISDDTKMADNKDITFCIKLAEQLAKQVRIKRVSLVGAGPGDEGLISEKGLERVRNAEVLVYDNLSATSFLNEAPVEAELIYVGKRAANHHVKQEETNKILVEKALEGKRVVRLKGGDPFIFGRGGEEAQSLNEAGIPFEIVPGISSSYAVAAYAGIPITHRDMASSFHVITGHEGHHKVHHVLDYKTLAKEEGTLVFMMGLGNLANITASLMENGKDKTTPTAVIQQGTTARQKTAIGTLENIVEEVIACGIKTPAVTVIGEAVGLRETLSWYEDAPLFGKKVLLTGTPSMVHKLKHVLQPTGAQAVAFSLIHTKGIFSKELAQVMQSIKEYNWLVFTSSNGVENFFNYLYKENIDIRVLANIKIGVIGEGTKAALLEKGFQSDFVPSKYSSEDFALEWIPTLQKNDKVLLLRAQEASPLLNDKLKKAGISFTDIALYETVYDMRKKEELNRIIEDIDYVTFASASAVKAFAEMIDDVSVVANKVICIGPVTAKAAEQLKIDIRQSALSYTAEGIRDVLLAEINS